MVDTYVVDSLQKPMMESGDPARFEKISAPTSRWEAFQTQFGLGRMDTLTYSNLFEHITRDQFPKGPQYDLDPETLNKLYPEIDVPFSQPTNKFVAQSIAEKAQERRYRQLVIDNAPGDLKQTLLNYAAIGAAHMTDPIEASLAIAASYTVAAGLQVAGVAPAGIGAMTGLKGLAARFGVSAAGNILSEVPTETLVAMNAKKNQEKYTILDSIINVSSAVLVGSILETAGWQLFGNRGGKIIDDLNTSKNATVAGKDPNIYTKHFEYDNPSFDTKYIEAPTFKQREGFGKATMYYDSHVQSATNEVGRSRAGRYATQTGLESEAKFQGFAKFTSNPDHATAKVLHSRLTKGVVIGVEPIENLKLYDMDIKFLDQNPRIKQKFEELINTVLELSDQRNGVMVIEGKVIPWEKLTVEDEVSAGQIFDSLSTKDRKIMEAEFADLLDSEGYDGLTFRNETAKATETVMFNENKLRDVEIAPVDPSEFANSRVVKDGEFIPYDNRPETLEQLKADLQSKETELGYRRDYEEEFNKLPAETQPEIEVDEVMKELKKAAEDSPQVAKLVDDLEKELDAIDELAKDIGDCTF